MAEREIPVDPFKLSYVKGGEATAVLFCRRQDSELQALMEAPPYQEPNTSQVELLDLKEVLADAIDELTPLELFIFNASVIERKGVRVIARMLVEEGLVPTFSKSGVHNALGRAIGKLRLALEDNQLIKGYLER